MNTEIQENPVIQNKQELYEALQQASILEHGLCCLYLFTAFSLKKTLDDFKPEQKKTKAQRDQCYLIMSRNRKWEVGILQVSREEMEHLGIDQNLINAIGCPPYFARPNFPIPASHLSIDIPYHLERFNERSISRYLLFEKPDYIEHAPAIEAMAEEPDPNCKCAEEYFPKKPHLPWNPMRYQSIQELYGAVQDAFVNLPPDEIFTGNLQKQVGETQTQFYNDVTMMTVMNSATAIQAIELVIAQGEGVGSVPLSPNTHFQWFAEILGEYRASKKAIPDYDVALPVLCDPMVRYERDGLRWSPEEPCNLVDAEPARSLMILFNESYVFMLSMLKFFFESFRGYFGTYPAFKQMDPNEAVFQTAFFPFMTMVIRPVSELLMRLPAGDAYPGQTAGPSFQLPYDSHDMIYLPYSEKLRWYDERLSCLEEECARLFDPEFLKKNRSAFTMDGCYISEEKYVEQVTYLYENMHRMRLNMQEYWRFGGHDAPF